MDTKNPPDPIFEVGAITDEFSPDSLDRALGAMADLGMTFAELRVVGGKNIIDHTDAEIDEVRAKVEARGMRVLSIASPVLKCTLPDAPPVAPHIQQDMFSSASGFDDQPRLARRAFEIAERMGARVVRVFSFWRTIDPDACFERVGSALRELADEALKRNLIVGIENEHACNIATGAETAKLLAAVDHPALQVIWDPANAFVTGEIPYPQGYANLPLSRIVHVHAKDCTVLDHVPTWGALGEMGIDWRGQLAALARDGYRGTISLETHWKGPNGDKFLGSMICGSNLIQMVSGATKKRRTKNEKGIDRSMMNLTVLHHVAISVSDLARARAFYGDVLGLEEIARPAFPFDGAWYRVGDQEVHLIVSRDPTFRTGKGVTLEDGHFALRAKSFRGALAHLESKGVRAGGDEPGRSMRVNAASVTGYPQIHILDPDRNVIEINAEKVD